jgi:hypothetical protein
MRVLDEILVRKLLVYRDPAKGFDGPGGAADGSI